jgi:DNA-binding transcriptional regulator YiaG
MEYNVELVKKLREELNITQSELARRLGVNHSTVWKWEHNKEKPSLNNFIKLVNLIEDEK